MTDNQIATKLGVTPEIIKYYRFQYNLWKNRKGNSRQNPVETGIKVVPPWDNCSRKTMLNFEPDLNKPIYCKDCLKKKYPKPSRQPIGLAEEATRQKPVSLKEAMDSQVQDFRRGRREE